MTTLYRTRSATVTARRPNAGPWRVVFDDGSSIKVPAEAFELIFEHVARAEYQLRRAVVYADLVGASKPYWRVHCPEDHVMDVRPPAFDLLFAPADRKNLQGLLAHAAWRSSKPWGDRYDWKLGRDMYELGKRAQEIARTLGCSEEAVKRRARKDKWKRQVLPFDRRGEDPRTRRKEDREILEDPAACPNCWKVTLTNPCAHCHMQLPVNGH